MTQIDYVGELRDGRKFHRVYASQPDGVAALLRVGVTNPCLVHTREAVDLRLAK